jgi:hypothetical protein
VNGLERNVKHLDRNWDTPTGRGILLNESVAGNFVHALVVIELDLEGWITEVRAIW